MDYEQSKKAIQDLITDFKIHYSKYRDEQEANIETKLVEPLFNILGWTKNDFVKREKTRREDKRGFVDYAFKINDRDVFYLEVKKLGIPLEKEANKQVISYALSKRIPFAVSTNFEQLKIFCVEQENAINQVFRAFDEPQDYISHFQDLLLLSKESFENNATLKQAEKEDRLKKRVSIDRTLLDDFMQIRKLIAEDIERTYPKKYDLNQKEEIVQRAIDRFIFIRRSEDVGINPDNLYLNELEHFPENKVYSKLKEVFERYNVMYNSGLFAPNVDNDLDNIKIDGAIIKRLIGYLYESRDKQYVYNFDWITADVLGEVYEQYLGIILAQTKSGKAKLQESQAHRKEQGIYYTPTYIVDYIVKAALLEPLKNKKTKRDIKVLDTACGSGSFLIKAFDYLYNDFSKDTGASQNKLDSQGNYSIKTDILKRNVYGVDLDNKAVEITKLNLLLKASEKNRKLPEELDLHIKQGNSLISESLSDTFEWRGDFQEGTFDVAIGNPPYVRQEELLPIKPYLESHYRVFNSMADLFVYFFERDIKLLKENGYFGIIVSNKWLKAGYGLNLRKFLKTYRIEQFIDFGDLGIFPDATTYPCIIILRKTEKQNPRIKVCQVKTLDFTDLESYVNENAFSFNQKGLDDNGWNFQNKEALEILNKIKKISTPLKDYIEDKTYFGIKTGFSEAFVINEATRDALIKEDSKSSEIIKPFLTGKEVRRYGIRFANDYIILTKIGVDIRRYPAILKWLTQFKRALETRWDKGNHWYELRACDYYDLFEKPKLIYGAITTNPRFTIDKKGYFANNANFFIPTEDKKLLAILNSKLGWFLIKNTCTQIRGGYQLIWKYFQNVPISKERADGIESLVDKMLSLNERLNELGGKKTAESAKLAEDIEFTSREIDGLVYKSYGITKEEKKVIEESLSD